MATYSSMPWTSVWPNLNAAVAKELRMLGLMAASYLVLRLGPASGRMSSSSMKCAPSTPGSHSL